MDQQCTVTRPGVSAVAGALAVELLVALLHHPLQGHAPADTLQTKVDASSFGLVPHQIRGSMTTFQNALLHGIAYNQCTACSPTVLDAYKSKGFAFLETVFNKSSILEEMTGLKELHEKTKKMLEVVEEADEEDDFDLV